jgi:glycosyltransferase involved in cell wall biosynthesis
MKIALVTNIPSPYRVPVFDRVAQVLGEHFLVLYSSPTEPNRQWAIPALNHPHRFLKTRVIPYGQEGFLHLNFDVGREVTRFNPQVVIIAGYGPTAQLAFLSSWMHHRRIVLFNEGWLQMESQYSARQRWVKRFMIRRAHAFLGASKKAGELYRHYGAPADRVFVTPMAVANERFAPDGNTQRDFDLLFSGQFIERKCPFFVADVAKLVSEKRPVRLLLLGDGPLREQTLQRLKDNRVDFQWSGFVQQDSLPEYVKRAKIFLFATQSDTWGIVANEACAAGLPVLTTPMAGVANDLVLDGVNGYVLDLDLSAWVEHVLRLLNDAQLYETLSRRAVQEVQRFTFDEGARQMLRACERAMMT